MIDGTCRGGLVGGADPQTWWGKLQTGMHMGAMAPAASSTWCLTPVDMRQAWHRLDPLRGRAAEHHPSAPTGGSRYHPCQYKHTVGVQASCYGRDGSTRSGYRQHTLAKGLSLMAKAM
jgi:hypothetical protein